MIMNKLNQKKLAIYIFSVIILFSIPIYIIISNFIALNSGTEYLFKVEAIDPYDMFRGNYLNINFKEREVYGGYYKDYDYASSEYYVTIGEYSNGFAYFKGISKTKPENTQNYYKTTAYYNRYSNKYTIITPTRYYMNENKSLLAEEIYNDNIDNTYVKVRVKDGQMVIVGIYVNDVLIDSIN